MGVCLLTDGISGSGWVTGHSEGTKAKPVFSSHPEQVVLTLQQSRHHEGLASTGCVDLKQISQSLSGDLLQNNQKKSCELKTRAGLLTLVQALSVTHFFSIK